MWAGAGLSPDRSLLQTIGDEGEPLTQTVWKWRACCVVVVYQIIALQIECPQN